MPGSRALYISFLRGFPVPMRRAAVGASECGTEDRRDGGGIFVEDELLAVGGILTDSETLAGDETSAGGGTLVAAWSFADSMGFT